MASGLYQLSREKMLNPSTTLFITGATNTTPIEVTTAKMHGLSTGDVVSIVGVGGNTAANGTWTITYVNATTFSLDTSVGNGAYTSGGEVLLSDILLRKSPWCIRWGVGSSGATYGDDIKAVLVNTAGTGTTYAVQFYNHEFLSSIDPGARISTSANFSAKTTSRDAGSDYVGGVADADDIVFTAVTPIGLDIEAIVIYKDTGTAATSPLIAYLDSTSVTGLPVVANGGNITVAWSAGDNRIFRL